MTATQQRVRAAAGTARPAARPGSDPRSTSLRIVPAGELSPRARRRRRRLLVSAVMALVVAALFGVVIEHAVLAEQQFRLASLQSQAASDQARNESLQLQVAQLQSPSRIVSQAQKLGMVTPPVITYLAPGHHGPKVQAQPAAPATSVPGASGSHSSSTTAGQEADQAASPPGGQP